MPPKISPKSSSKVNSNKSSKVRPKVSAKISDDHFQKIGRVTNASVLKATGKGWAEWIALLVKAGARTWTHQEIVAFLKKRHKLGPWWQQWVTSGYESAIGRRVEGQNSKGEYHVTATKSLPLTVKTVWKILVSDAGQSIWLKPLYKGVIAVRNTFETGDGFFGEIRTLKKDRRVRMTWQDPDWSYKTVVQVTLVPRPGERSILVIDHLQIKDLRVRAEMRKRWRDSVDELAKLIQRPRSP
jgi:uncharacterized protein YndB with AHSA1/START domain